MKKVLTISTVLILCVLVLVSCQNKTEIMSKARVNTYITDENNVEVFAYYTIVTLTRSDNNEIGQLIETYSPDGTLWITIDNTQFIYSDAYTNEVKEYHNQLVETSAYSLVGKNSDDLIYEKKCNESGEIEEEIYSSKSGTYTTLRSVYEKIE